MNSIALYYTVIIEIIGIVLTIVLAYIASKGNKNKRVKLLFIEIYVSISILLIINIFASELNKFKSIRFVLFFIIHLIILVIYCFIKNKKSLLALFVIYLLISWGFPVYTGSGNDGVAGPREDDPIAIIFINAFGIPIFDGYIPRDYYIE